MTALTSPLVEHQPLVVGGVLRVSAAAAVLACEYCLQSNADITGEFSVLPQNPSLSNFAEIWRNPVWSEAFANSLLCAAQYIDFDLAVPAAYVFSRYRFLGDRQLFFWLLTNRMAPPAVFLLPFFQLYSAVGLFDTPLAVALALFVYGAAIGMDSEGFMSGVSTELDDMARIDGHSFGYFFLRICAG